MRGRSLPCSWRKIARIVSGDLGLDWGGAFVIAYTKPVAPVRRALRGLIVRCVLVVISRALFNRSPHSSNSDQPTIDGAFL